MTIPYKFRQNHLFSSERLIETKQQIRRCPERSSDLATFPDKTTLRKGECIDMSEMSQFFDGMATVSKTIRPPFAGRVHFRGTWWNAVCQSSTTLNPGDLVRVVDREGITLIVELVSRISTIESPETIVHLESDEVRES